MRTSIRSRTALRLGAKPERIAHQPNPAAAMGPAGCQRGGIHQGGATEKRTVLINTEPPPGDRDKGRQAGSREVSLVRKSPLGMPPRISP